MCCIFAGRFHRKLLCQDLRWPRHSGPSMPKIIAHYQREDEPRRSHCAPQRTANLRFPNARIVAHWHLNDAESPERTFQNYFNRPAVRVLLEVKPAEDICSPGTERSKVAYPDHTKV